MKRPRSTLVALLTGVLLTAALAARVDAQDGVGSGGAAGGPSAPSSAAGLEPVFPPATPGFVFVEGEAAVSTSFAAEPILNFGCSGYRTLQLSRVNPQQGGRAYVATYVFYLEEPGLYELWYGGTPPGPKDDLFPSYASPFSFRLDGGEERLVYREDVAVVERYAPAYYWNRVGEIELPAGAHTIDFLVSEPRRHDNRFYFYLDAFFLRGAGRSASELGDARPEVFPRDLADRSIDFPFRPLEDYQIAIRDNPGTVEGYLEIAEIYALLGDYLNGLRYLKRAELVAPEDGRVKLLLAKTRIWKGEVAEGLKNYRELLLLEPERSELWLEAGKVAAWSGRYEDSLALLRGGLQRFPEDPNLSVNLGLTLLWSGRLEEAESQFRRAESLAQGDFRLVAALARVYTVNGYPERAAALLRSALRNFPERLEPYLLLESIYTEGHDGQNAAAVRAEIARVFRPSARLERYLELFRRKQALRDEVIAGYERQMREEPENLPLRELLAQTYFWNGQRDKAIEEYRRLLANHAFQEVTRTEEESEDLLILLDRAALYRAFLQAMPEALKERRSALASRLGAYAEAYKADQVYREKVAAAREKGETPPAFKGEDPAVRLEREGAALGGALGVARSQADSARSLLATQEQDRLLLAELESRDQEIAESFARVVQPIRWQWDRRGFLSEFGALHSVLADYVLGRIALSEDRLADAEALFRVQDRDEAVPPEFSIALFQSLLWQGRVEAALAVGKSAALEAGHRPAHWAELEALAQDVEAATSGDGESEARAEAGGGLRSADPEQEVRAVLSSLQELGQAVAEARVRLDEQRAVLGGLYTRRMVRAMYRLEENTYLIRNELGGYYLREENYEAAIRQFRQVLSVDPWNIDAVYRLGKVYEWNGNWSQAMKNYQTVYFTDPAYEDVNAQYNRLAREHADSLGFAAWSLLDTSTFVNHGEASFSQPLDSRFGVRLTYAGEDVRNFGGPRSPANYFVHTASVAAPLSLASGRLELTPVVGGQLIADLRGGTGTWPEPVAEPLAGLDLAATLGSYVYLEGGYRFQRQEDSLAPGLGLPRLYSHLGEINLNASLAFIPVYPFRNSAARTYASGELVTEGAAGRNLLYSVAEELTVGLVRRKEPTLDLSLIGNVVFEGAAREEPVAYYAPQGVLLATGGLSASTWLSVSENSALQLGLRAAAGSYQEGLLTDTPARKVQVEGQVDLGFSRGEASYYLQGMFSSTYEYERVGGTAAGWDYWSLYVTLGFSTSLPRLLAP